MEGVLEAAITLYGCKVLCSILCLPAFKDSVSCVSLCCSCLLLFTDVSITMFLVYLWSAVPRPLFFHPSSDVIALRFLLFLGNTYEAVLMLTPLLVTVEMLVRLLWATESMTLIEGGSEAMDDKDCSVKFLMDADGDNLMIEAQNKEEQAESSRDTFKALGFLGCLLLWGICGTYAVFSCGQEQLMVRTCLERGSLLSACLPCLLTASSPVQGQLFWVLPAAGLLLALNAILSLLVAKLTSKFAQQGKQTCAEDKSNAFQLLQTEQPTQRTLILAVSMLHNRSVDSKETDSSCVIHGSPSAYKKRRWAYGDPEALARGTELAGSCKLNSQGITLISPQQCTSQTTHPCKSWIRQAQRESPNLRVELVTGLLCGLLVCVFPTVLSTNILLLSNLDTLAVYMVQNLLTLAQGK